MSPVVDSYAVAPGTVFIVDVLQKHSNLAHAQGKNKNIVLVPQPSTNDRDPLVS
jgi:hypothetical protein